jgi:hydrogenase maturation factor
MNLLEGTLTGIHFDQTSRVGKVDIGGAQSYVSLLLVPDTNVGDKVLVVAGVALSRIESPPSEEKENVSGNTR